jgi:hypothetical protein
MPPYCSNSFIISGVKYESIAFNLNFKHKTGKDANMPANLCYILSNWACARWNMHSSHIFSEKMSDHLWDYMFFFITF